MPATRSNGPASKKPATARPRRFDDALTWGEKVHLAYRRSRATYGHTYREVAERISQIFPTTDATIVRLESYDTVPKQERVRIVAYLALLAYGFDPSDFGLSPDNVRLDKQVLKRAAGLLKPRNSCFATTAA